MRWLPRGAWPLLRVDVDDERTCSFYAALAKRPLLVLQFSPERSAVRSPAVLRHRRPARAPDQARAGSSSGSPPTASHLLTAIHEFLPRLPWWLYRLTQAIVHRWVMKRFGRHLAAIPPAPTASAIPTTTAPPLVAEPPARMSR